MALTMAGLRKLLDGEGLKYFLHPDQPIVLMGVGALNGSYQIGLSLQNEGEFLQLRTLGYVRCPATHEHLATVLRTLAEINFRVRFVKFGWDPQDGEIMAYADMWVMDGTVTQAQFSRILANLIPTIDLNFPRIGRTMETGKDPGGPELPGMPAGGFPSTI